MLSTFQRLSRPFRKALITEKEIGIRQMDGWLYLPKEEIAAIKFSSVSNVIVRLYDGRRFEVSLFGFSISTYSRIIEVLRSALHENRKRRGLWEGAESD